MKGKNLLYCSFLLLISLVNAKGQENIPIINQQIVGYTEKVIGKSIGRGECWDLADYVLTATDAEFDKSSNKTLYIFGELYDPDQESILPGDIIQFQDVEVKEKEGNIIYTSNYKHHTAIVYQVLNKKRIKLAHQNTSFSARTVGVNVLNLEDVSKGRMFFYHPIPKQ